MAKRDDSKFQVSHWDGSNAVGALAAYTLDLFSLAVWDDDIYIINADIAVFWKAISSAAEHSILYGLSDASLTIAEVEEHIQSDGPPNRGSSVEAEIAQRKVIMLGTLDPSELNANGLSKSEFMKREKISVSIYNEGTATLGTNGLNFWYYNTGADAIETGSTIGVIATIFSRWM